MNINNISLEEKDKINSVNYVLRLIENRTASYIDESHFSNLIEVSRTVLKGANVPQEQSEDLINRLRENFRNIANYRAR